MCEFVVSERVLVAHRVQNIAYDTGSLNDCVDPTTTKYSRERNDLRLT